MVGDSLPPRGDGGGGGCGVRERVRREGVRGSLACAGARGHTGELFRFCFPCAREGDCAVFAVSAVKWYFWCQKWRDLHASKSRRKKDKRERAGLFVRAHDRRVVVDGVLGSFPRDVSAADGAEGQRNHDGQHDEEQAERTHTEARCFRVFFHVRGV